MSYSLFCACRKLPTTGPSPIALTSALKQNIFWSYMLVNFIAFNMERVPCSTLFLWYWELDLARTLCLLESILLLELCTQLPCSTSMCQTFTHYFICTSEVSLLLEQNSCTKLNDFGGINDFIMFFPRYWLRSKVIERTWQISVQDDIEKQNGFIGHFCMRDTVT
jgi:hypothetical protein